MAVDALTGFLQITADFTVSKTLTGFTNPLSFANQIQKRQNYTLGAGAGAAQELYAAVLTISGGGNTVIDLRTFTDALQRAGQVMSKLKGVLIWLLGTGDTLGSVTGTACTGITVGNDAADPHKLFMDADADTFTLGPGDWVAWGTGSAGGETVDATHKDVKILNNDGAVDAKVAVVFLGA